MPELHVDVQGHDPFDVLMIRFTASGSERAHHHRRRSGRRPLSSATVAARLTAAADAGTPYTDVIVMTHGWLADKAGAEETFTAWAQTAAEALSGSVPPGRTFRPLVVGLCWPSRPPMPGRRHRFRTAPLLTSSPAGTERSSGREHPTVLDTVSLVVPWASFYTMKARAGRIGRTGAARTIRLIQTAAGTAHVHLVGHSFGCVLLAESLVTGRGHPAAARPVATLFLVQGALSAWAFAAHDPYTRAAGSVAEVVAADRVRGVLLATTTRWDFALGRVFPGAQFLDFVVTTMRHLPWRFGRLTRPGAPPRLAALGHAGFAGVPGVRQMCLRRSTNASSTRLGMAPGRVHHLDCDDVLDTALAPDPADPRRTRRFDEFLVGAHSNLLHPELAAAFWEAVFASAPKSAVTGPLVGDAQQEVGSSADR